MTILSRVEKLLVKTRTEEAGVKPVVKVFCNGYPTDGDDLDLEKSIADELISINMRISDLTYSEDFEEGYTPLTATINFLFFLPESCKVDTADVLGWILEDLNTTINIDTPIFNEVDLAQFSEGLDASVDIEVTVGSLPYGSG